MYVFFFMGMDVDYFWRILLFDFELFVLVVNLFVENLIFLVGMLF